MKFSLRQFLLLSLMAVTGFAYADETPLILILTTPDLQTPPPGYTLMKTLSATAELPPNIQGPLDNPALQNMITQAKTMQASALLGLNCQTNGHTIACTSNALSHDFSQPGTNTFSETAHLLFGDHFYNDPTHYPPTAQLTETMSVTFYLAPSEYRTVSGENVQENKAWWGLKRESMTVRNPEIPALCIDSLHFFKALNENHPGLVNFNCSPSTSSLPGYIQINATADGVSS